MNFISSINSTNYGDSGYYSALNVLLLLLLFVFLIAYQALIRGTLGLIFFVEGNKRAFVYSLVAYIILDGSTMITIGDPMAILVLPLLPFYYRYVIKQANKFKAQHAKV